MSPTSPSNMALELPENSSRNRSVSVGDSGLPQHEHKRPRLSELDTESPSISSTEPPSVSDDRSAQSSKMGAPSLQTPPDSPLPSTNPSKVISPTSKVTINTRPLSSQSTRNAESTLTGKSSVSKVNDSSTSASASESPVMVSLSDEESSKVASGEPNEPISISSSTSVSPVLDGNTSETIDDAATSFNQWSSLSFNAIESETVRLGHIRQNFPYVEEGNNAPRIITEMAQHLEIGGSEDANIISRLTSWFDEFTSGSASLSYLVVEDDHEVWQQIPRLIISLLKRKIDMRDSIQEKDLVNFFTSYGRLTIRLARFDLQRLQEYPDKVDPKLVKAPHFFEFLRQLANLLHAAGPSAFYAALHMSQRLEPTTIIEATVDNLLHDVALELINISAEVLKQLLRLVAHNSRLLGYISYLMQYSSSIFQALGPRISLMGSSCGTFRKAFLSFLLNANSSLEHAIKKQQPWLSIDNSQAVISNFWTLTSGVLCCFPDLSSVVVRAAGVDPEAYNNDELQDASLYAYRFYVLLKYIRHGRMELRVYGIENMATCLVDIWTRFQQLQNPNSAPIVRFTVAFLQQNGLIKYILGVDSHPQIVQRSCNVIGFLCISSNWQPTDTDVAFHAILDSQDPRSGTAVLDVLKANVHHLDAQSLHSMYSKLLELPFERVDSKIFSFTMAVLQTGAQRFTPLKVNEPLLHLALVKLCLRLLRDASSPMHCGNGLTDQVRFEIHRFLLNDHRRCYRNILEVMSVDEKSTTLKVLCDDISKHSDFATGSVLAMNLLLTTLDPNDSIALVQQCDYTRLLVKDTARPPSFQGNGTSDVLERSLWAFYEIRFSGLVTLIMGMPDTFDEVLIQTLWSVLLTPQMPAVVRSLAWNNLAGAFQQCSFRNHVLDSLITNCFPSLPPTSFDQAVLSFVEQSVEYEMRLSPAELVDPNAAIEIPGMERIWRIMLEAVPHTIDDDASDFIIHQYLDSDTMTRRSDQSIDATHSALIDRCVRTVTNSANNLKAISEESMEMNENSAASEASSIDGHAQQLRFNRSLLFLRKFLSGIKARPRYRILTANNIQPILDTFKPKGSNIELTLIISSHPSISSVKHSWVVGDENTGEELFQFLYEVTGWPQMNFIKGGERYPLQSQTMPLRDIKFGPGPVMLSKAYGVQDSTPTRSIRATSPVESKVMHHFEDLYSLLDANDTLAKEIYEFLTMFSSQETIVEDIRSMRLTAEELLPVNHPFRLLYYIRALRSCIEDESFSSTPNIDFIQYAVITIITSLSRLESMRGEPSVLTTIFHGITETLLLALRAKVSESISLSYFGDQGAFASQILKIWGFAYTAAEKNIVAPSPPVLIRTPFEVLVEASLHDPRLWEEIVTRNSYVELFGKSILLDTRSEVRNGILDIICRLVGISVNKLHKQNDERSPRSRFPLDRIESCLVNLWGALRELILIACTNKASSQQFFEATWLILRAIGTKMTQDDLQELFQQLKTFLLSHSYEQDIGQEPKDYVLWGLAKLIHQCCLLMSRNGTIPTDGEALITEIFARFLFPALSSDDRLPTDAEAIPVLDSNTREALYDLVIALSANRTCLSKAVAELEYGDLIDANAFFVNSSNERRALRSNVGYSGLRNLSNTCYLNSLLTQLFMNLKFREFILDVNIVDETKQKLALELAEVFANLQSSYEKYISPEEAVDAITQYDGEQIDVTVQMDVDEFFNLLFDRLESQIIDAESRTTFKSMYGGQLVQQIKSKECEHVSERLEPFSAVQIEIRGKSGLEEGLTAYVEGEVLQGDNKYSCTSCGRHVDAIKRACLKDLPDNLIFNLKRFDFDIMTGTRCKINDEFQFPETINMAPFTIEALSNPNEPIPPDSFELVGVIIHSGTAETGHYYSYVRQRPSATNKHESWVQFNDQDVTKFDPSMLRDCAFGGVDSSFNNMPKFYNGYMLFYQRSSSIQQYEQKYPATDPVNPVKVLMAEDLTRRVTLRNELSLRTFVIQDPVHAKFVRQLTERIPTEGEKCSPNHDIETSILNVSLEYLQLVSSRWREAPELEEMVKLLVIQAGRCELCAVNIVQWFALEDNVVVNVLRTFFTTARRAFATLLCGALSGACLAKLKWSSEPIRPENRNDIGIVNTAISECVGKLYRGWDYLQRNSRSWDSYFGVLSHIITLGDEEASLVIDAGFLEKTLELIWIHTPGPPTYSKELRQRYSFYLSAREKNKMYGHAHLLECFAAIIQHVDLDEHSEKPEAFHTTSRLLPNSTETSLLCLTSNTRRPSWLSKIILGRHNPDAAIEIVKELCNYVDRLPVISKLILEGLEDANSIANAVAFLDPALAFIEHCPDEDVVQDLTQQALESIETTNGHYANEFLRFVSSIASLSTGQTTRTENNLEKIILDRISCWAPTLVMAPNDMQHDVRNDALELINQILFIRLEELEAESNLNHGNAIIAVRKLTRSCVSHVRKTFLNPQPRDRLVLQPGQSTQVGNLLETCKSYFSADNAEDEAILEAIESVMEELNILAQNTSETLEDWREPSSDLEQLSDIESLEFSS